MSTSKYTVKIYPKAENDLFEVQDYFVNKLKVSPMKLFQKFYDYIDTLEENPFLFPLMKDDVFNELGYRMITVDNFLLFYIIEGNEVKIHRFLYGKRNYLSIL